MKSARNIDFYKISNIQSYFEIRVLFKLIFLVNYFYVAQCSIEKPLFSSYPFSCTNPRHDFIKQVGTFFSKKPITVTNPPDWPGEGGKAVNIPVKLKKVANKRFKENQFNIVASDMIAINRSIPDSRLQA